jgi:hypothetical protein
VASLPPASARAAPLTVELSDELTARAAIVWLVAIS